MPFITYNSGLTIKSPTRGTRNYEQTMRTDTFQKISEHDHTGGGRGVQLGTGAIANNSITDLKIRLRNNQWLRSRNAADNGDINIVKVNASNVIELGANVHSVLTLPLANDANTTLGLILNPAKIIGAQINYSVKRVADSTVSEAGMLLLTFNGTAWQLSPERTGDAGISFSINSSGVLSYVTSDLSGHVSSNMYLLVITTGV